MKKTTAPPSEMTFLLIRKIKSSPRSLLEALWYLGKTDVLYNYQEKSSKFCPRKISEQLRNLTALLQKNS